MVVFVHPLTGSQTSVVQPSPSSQLSGVPGRQAPDVGSQVSTPLHTFPSPQFVAAVVGAPRHAPLTHSSPCVQAFPSSHRPVSCVWVGPLSGSAPSVVDALHASSVRRG